MLNDIKTDSIDFENNNHFKILQSDLEKLDSESIMRIEVNDGLEEAFTQLDELKSELSQDAGDSLIDQCKTTVIETITGQFGLASLFIDSKDGGNVTTTHNFEKGITASEQDLQKYDDFTKNNDGTKKWGEVRKDTGYDTPLPQKRKDAFKNQGIIIDEYTGKPLPKDGRAHLDHVVSAKEIEANAANNLHLTPEERAKMATSDENLAWTEASANQSKGEHFMKEWLYKEDKQFGVTKGEKYEIDRDKAMAKDDQARKSIKRTVNKSAVKNYSKEVLKSGGKDAAKMAAYSAIGIVMRDFTQGTFQAIKETFAERESKTFKELLIMFKNKMQKVLEGIKNKWKDILKSSLESGITAFFSNLLVFVINLFATTLKKFVLMIRAGFVSLVQAIKIIANPPAGMSPDEAKYQAAKIVTAGLIGAASLGMSAAIEKLLQGIPGLQPIMMFPIPSIGKEKRTISDILAVTISALLGGLLTTVTIYLMDRFRKEGQQTKLHIQLVYQSGLAVEYKQAQTWFVLKDAYRYFEEQAIDVLRVSSEAEEEVEESIKAARESHSGYSSAVDRLRQLRAQK